MRNLEQPTILLDPKTCLLGLKRLVLGEKKRPTAANTEAWEDDCEKAAGWIAILIQPDQKIHIHGMDDPVKMWEKLKSVHIVKH